MSIEKTLFDEFQEYKSNYSVLEKLPIVISLRKENKSLQSKIDLLLTMLAEMNNKQNIIKHEPLIDIDKIVITDKNIKLNNDSITNIPEQPVVAELTKKPTESNKITYEIIEDTSVTTKQTQTNNDAKKSNVAEVNKEIKAEKEAEEEAEAEAEEEVEVEEAEEEAEEEVEVEETEEEAEVEETEEEVEVEETEEEVEVEETEKEVEVEEDDENQMEVFEVNINGTVYYTDDDVNGVIYDADDNIVGKYNKGKAKLNKK